MGSLAMTGPVPGTTQLATAADWETFFGPMLADGVLSGMTPSLDTSGRNAVISAGSAFLRAYVAKAGGSNMTAIPAASGQDRIDRLVLRLDRTQTTEATWIVPTVITGTPGSSPVAPAILSSPTGSWDLPISHWTSKSAGGLINLVDDRVFASGPAQLLATTGQTPLQARAGVLIDPATPTLMFSADGATWESVWSGPTDTWHTIGLGGGWGAVSGFGVPKYRLSNDGVLQFAGAVGKNGSVSGATITTLPSGYFSTVTRSAMCRVMGVDGSTFDGSYIQVDSSGNLKLTASSPNGAVNFIAMLDGVTMPIST